MAVLRQIGILLATTLTFLCLDYFLCSVLFVCLEQFLFENSHTVEVGVETMSLSNQIVNNVLCCIDVLLYTGFLQVCIENIFPFDRTKSMIVR